MNHGLNIWLNYDQNYFLSQQENHCDTFCSFIYYTTALCGSSVSIRLTQSSELIICYVLIIVTGIVCH